MKNDIIIKIEGIQNFNGEDGKVELREFEIYETIF